MKNFSFFIAILCLLAQSSIAAISQNPEETGVSGPMPGSVAHNGRPDVITDVDINATSTESPFKIALISGVPRYYQKDTSCEDYGVACVCLDQKFLTGCGPVAGATVLAWWDRRGYENLVDDNDVDSDGMPQNLIIELGKSKYMDRITGCGATAVLPGKLKKGLEKYIEEKGYQVEIHRYRIKEEGKYEEVGGDEKTGTIAELFEIVKNEILHGRPLIYGLRSDGEKKNNGTFKQIDHYVTVVGYDNTEGDYNLIIQPNWEDGGYLNGYYNMYDKTHTRICLTDYTSNDFLRYNLFTIKITSDSPVSYRGHCKGLTLESFAGSNYYDPSTPNFDKCGLLDGYHNRVFYPDMSSESTHTDFELYPTDQLKAVDGECFVAGWYDKYYMADQSSWDSDLDNYSDACDYPELYGIINSVDVNDSGEDSIEVDVEFMVSETLGINGTGNRSFHVSLNIDSDGVDLKNCVIDDDSGSVSFGKGGVIGQTLKILELEPLDRSNKRTMHDGWKFDLTKCPIDGCIRAEVTLRVDMRDEVTEMSELDDPEFSSNSSENEASKTFMICNPSLGQKRVTKRPRVKARMKDNRLDLSLDLDKEGSGTGDYFFSVTLPDNSSYWLTSNLTWSNTQQPVYQGEIVSFRDISLFHDVDVSGLPPGTYKFTFSVDENPDGVLDDTADTSTQSLRIGARTR